MRSIILQKMLVSTMGLKCLHSVTGFAGLSRGTIIKIFYALGSFLVSHDVLKRFSIY